MPAIARHCIPRRCRREHLYDVLSLFILAGGFWLTLLLGLCD